MNELRRLLDLQYLMYPRDSLRSLEQNIPELNDQQVPQDPVDPSSNFLRDLYANQGDQPQREQAQRDAMLARQAAMGDQPGRTQQNIENAPQPQAPQMPEPVRPNTLDVSMNDPGNSSGGGFQVNPDFRVLAAPGNPTHIGITDDPVLAARNGWTLIGQNKQGGQSQGAPQGQGQAQGQAQGPTNGPMRVIGTGNGTTVELSPEVAPARVNLDYSRTPVEIMGTKAYYSKDQPGVAYAVDGNGNPTAKVLLGYDMQGSMALSKANLDQAHTRQEIAQSQASVEHTQEQIRASKVNNPDMGTFGPPGALVTGEAALANVDPGTAGIVRQMVQGRMAPPGQFALRSPRVMNLLALANQVDPSFDATTWAERYKTAQDFSPGGKSGQAVQSITQAIHHAGQFSQAIDDLNNSNVMPSIVNPVVNAFEQKILGDPRQGVFTTKANALASELRKVYAGSGGGTLQELDRWQSSFDPNAGQDQQRAYLKAGLQLLNGAIESRKASYERGMGPKADFGNLIDPSSQAILSRLTGGGTQVPSAAPASQPMNSMPDPKTSAGRVIRDTASGQTYRSNGREWIIEGR